MARRELYAYPVRLEPDPDGGYVVFLPDIGYGATQGDDLAEALAQAEDLLEDELALAVGIDGALRERFIDGHALGHAEGPARPAGAADGVVARVRGA